MKSDLITFNVVRRSSKLAVAKTQSSVVKPERVRPLVQSRVGTYHPLNEERINSI